MTDLVAAWVVEFAGWAHANPRAASVSFVVLLVVVGVIDTHVTWVYRLTTKDGEAVRAGVTRFDRLGKRMWEYASGKDSSTKKGEAWHRRVRWWLPPIPYRLAKRLGCKAWTGKGAQPGWSRWFVTLEIRWGRKRAERYESQVIRQAEPWFNYRDNPRTAARWQPEPRVLTLPWRRGREKVAA